MTLSKWFIVPSSQRCPLNPAIQSKHVPSTMLHKPPRHLSGHAVEKSLPYIPGFGHPNYILDAHENINIKVSRLFKRLKE